MRSFHAYPDAGTALIVLLLAGNSDEEAALAAMTAALPQAGWVPTSATSFRRGWLSMKMSTSSQLSATDVRLALR